MNRVPSAICGYPTHPCMGAALTPAGTLKNIPPNARGIARGGAHSIRLRLCCPESIRGFHTTLVNSSLELDSVVPFEPFLLHQRSHLGLNQGQPRRLQVRATDADNYFIT